MTMFRTILWYITLLCVIKVSVQDCTVQTILQILECEHMTNFPDVPTWINQYGEQFREIHIIDSNLTILKVHTFQSLDVGKINITLTALRIIEPSGFNNLPHLSYLNLGNNNISQITRGVFNQLTNLAILSLSNNRIQFIEANSFLGTQLRSLHLGGNKIEDISAIVDNCGSYEYLYLHFNDITNIHALTNCTKLRILRMSYNNIVQLQNKIFPTSLVDLSLGNNKIESVETESFAGMTNLNTLDLKYNKLYSIPLGLFQPLTELRSLDLSGNELSRLLPGTFTQLTSLETLKIGYNMLTDLPTGLLNHLPLKFLWINNNRLTKLGDKIFNQHYDITINMDDNHWSCNYLSHKIDQIIRVNPSNRINRGHHISTPNINGIKCTDTILEDKNNTMDMSSRQNYTYLLQKLGDIEADQEETNTLLVDIKELFQNLTLFRKKDNSASPDLFENVTYSRSQQLRNFPNSYDSQIRVLLLLILLAIIALIVVISSVFALIVYNYRRNSQVTGVRQDTLLDTYQ